MIPSQLPSSTADAARTTSPMLWSLACILLSVTPASSLVAQRFAVDRSQPGRLTILANELPVATYVYDDDQITRPYFADVKTPDGVQVTRNHPPRKGIDLTDHATFHPGVWMTFGDISGNDYWRLKSRTVHETFVEPPTVDVDRLRFTVRNQYLASGESQKLVCHETCRLEFRKRPQGFLLCWDSTFTSPQEFEFGDQEEMGLGFRVASALRAEKRSSKEPDVPAGNGTIVDAAGNQNEVGVWGSSADWCNYSGPVDQRQAGIAIFSHPDNLRRSWYHARDRGYVVANMFGRAAMGHGQKSRIVIKPGNSLRLRYGLLFHSRPLGTTLDLDAMYQSYVSTAD